MGVVLFFFFNQLLSAVIFRPAMLKSIDCFFPDKSFDSKLVNWKYAVFYLNKEKVKAFLQFMLLWVKSGQHPVHLCLFFFCFFLFLFFVSSKVTTVSLH